MKNCINAGGKGRRLGFLLLLTLFLLVSRSTAGDKKPFLEAVKEQDEKLDTHRLLAVAPVLVATVVSREEYQGGSFRVLARKQEVERFRCSNCHTDKPVTVNNGFNLTHGEVVLNHGMDGNKLSCIDCHHPKDRDALEDKKGNKIDFDHSYQLCGQCHFRQKRDWLGGAHGKRVEHWAGERVVYNCTTCHNPHNPRFSPRFPATYAVPLQ
jgi:hypothetical protein